LSLVDLRIEHGEMDERRKEFNGQSRRRGRREAKIRILDNLLHFMYPSKTPTHHTLHVRLLFYITSRGGG
jgi:hypothetical protein